MGEIEVIDDKVSISIKNSGDYSTMERGQARAKAEKIVACDFKCEDVLTFREDNASLVLLLKSYTSDLLPEYITRCKNWERFEFSEREKWIQVAEGDKDEKWYNYFGIACHQVYPGKPHSFWSVDYDVKGARKLYDKVCDQSKAIRKYLDKGLEKAIECAEILAINHYNSAISTLAFRIEDKGLNINSMEVLKSGISGNIELLLSDGENSIKAWTIWAEGEVNRPHFRYLVR